MISINDEHLRVELDVQVVGDVLFQLFTTTEETLMTAGKDAGDVVCHCLFRILS